MAYRNTDPKEAEIPALPTIASVMRSGSRSGMASTALLSLAKNVILSDDYTDGFKMLICLLRIVTMMHMSNKLPAIAVKALQPVSTIQI